MKTDFFLIGAPKDKYNFKYHVGTLIDWEWGKKFYYKTNPYRIEGQLVTDGTNIYTPDQFFDLIKNIPKTLELV